MSQTRGDDDDPTEMIDPETLAELLALTRAKQNKQPPAPAEPAPQSSPRAKPEPSAAPAAAPVSAPLLLLLSVVVSILGAVALYFATP